MRSELKKEALRRMRVLRLLNSGYDSPVGDFQLRERAWKSEAFGILYYLDEKDIKAIKQFEQKYKKYEMKVYHCYKAYTEFGTILYMLYVSNNEDDTPESFDEGLRRGYTFVYAHNFDDEYCSEFGSVSIRSQYGGIVVR